MKITVVGAGYVGCVTSVCLADFCHEVICIDINQAKIEKLNAGINPIYEAGVEGLLQKNLGKTLFFTTSPTVAYKNCDVIFVCVGTPERSDGSANLEYVDEVIEKIAGNIKKDVLVVIKSTVPIGTCDKIQARLTKISSYKVEVASNPEFLSQGRALHDTLYAQRIILGVESKKAENLLKTIYQPFNVPIVVMNRKSAEMVKYASNDFLALKISFINDIANLCEIVGANIEDVTNGMRYDKRIGREFLNAGIGYGGSCFPKDTKALHWLSSQHGYELKTVKAAIEVNENQKFKLYKKAIETVGSLKGKVITILGLTFKPNTDDLREAPSIVNVKAMLEQHAIIKAYDPVGMKKFKKLFPEITYEQSIISALKNSECCFIFTEWEEIKKLKPQIFNDYMKIPRVFDGRNCFDVSEMNAANILYYSIGR